VRVGAPVGAGVASSSVQSLPELTFTQTMFFPYRDQPLGNAPAAEDTAPSGAQVVADAQIKNRGPAGSYVRLDYFLGLPGSGSEVLLGLDKVYLSPGQTYDISHPFPVKQGTHTYAIRASALGGQEVTGPTGRVTSATLIGMADVDVAGLTLSDPAPYGGKTVTVTAEIDNLSDQAVGPFTAAFYQGDPNFKLPPATLLATKAVTGLAAFGKVLVSFPWTVPAKGGNFVLTVRADSAQVLQDANRSNNDGHLTVSVLPDAAVILKGESTVQATLLNYSGVNNVNVSAQVSNFGRADLSNVPVVLFWAVDDGAFQKVGSTILASLPAGTIHAVSFTTNGLAGANRYRVVVDPDSFLADSDRANNVA
jgi:hypothetical protein